MLEAWRCARGRRSAIKVGLLMCNRATGDESLRSQEPGKPQLVMRAPLMNLPECVVPASYSIRCFEPGDEHDWEEIIRDSFGDLGASFDKMMRSDNPYQPERVLLACCDGRPVATASAWYRPEWGENTGYLHMVGTHSSHTRKGLGFQVSLAALHRMIAEGRTSAVLQTDDFRIPAIKTYLKLGFEPLIVHENQPERWRDVFSAIGRPELVDRFFYVPSRNLRQD